MSLLDALLLDPVRINVWVAKRADGISGSGTQNDPYDGSTAAKFDTLMRDVIGVNTCVHLGPGEFATAGYYDGLTGSGWQAKSGVRIVAPETSRVAPNARPITTSLQRGVRQAGVLPNRFNGYLGPPVETVKTVPRSLRHSITTSLKRG